MFSISQKIQFVVVVIVVAVVVVVKFIFCPQIFSILSCLFFVKINKIKPNTQLINTLKIDIGIDSKNFHFFLCCKDLFNTFTAKGFSGTSPIMHLSKHIFQRQ